MAEKAMANLFQNLSTLSGAGASLVESRRNRMTSGILNFNQEVRAEENASHNQEYAERVRKEAEENERIKQAEIKMFIEDSDMCVAALSSNNNAEKILGYMEWNDRWGKNENVKTLFRDKQAQATFMAIKRMAQNPPMYVNERGDLEAGKLSVSYLADNWGNNIMSDEQVKILNSSPDVGVLRRLLTSTTAMAENFRFYNVDGNGKFLPTKEEDIIRNKTIYTLRVQLANEGVKTTGGESVEQLSNMLAQRAGELEGISKRSAGVVTDGNATGGRPTIATLGDASIAKANGLMAQLRDGSTKEISIEAYYNAMSARDQAAADDAAKDFGFTNMSAVIGSGNSVSEQTVALQAAAGAATPMNPKLTFVKDNFGPVYTTDQIDPAKLQDYGDTLEGQDKTNYFKLNEKGKAARYLSDQVRKRDELKLASIQKASDAYTMLAKAAGITREEMQSKTTSELVKLIAANNIKDSGKSLATISTAMSAANSAMNTLQSISKNYGAIDESLPDPQSVIKAKEIVSNIYEALVPSSMIDTTVQRNKWERVSAPVPRMRP